MNFTCRQNVSNASILSCSPFQTYSAKLRYACEEAPLVSCFEILRHKGCWMPGSDVSSQDSFLVENWQSAQCTR
ncbi:hypothetical protein GYMLUDRAFT_40308 [Collybiopsis luxurians FD-317 M1]|uniref:Uncharacterized protein n=1 Tax=Collybiopsis luxurians FD-317 M1 TaxID=944289 RepID=A0A0D0D437_9AGAR|nr:hypothetical protein GYMLUDRAFT_40308 [Collybiopsis luxurians FD-317 M1]